MAGTLLIATMLVSVGCSSSGNSITRTVESDDSQTPPPELDSLGAEVCDDLLSPVVRTPDGAVDVTTLPVFDDYPGSDAIFYDDRTGDYMDQPSVALGEEDAHRVEQSENERLLLVRIDGEAELSEDILQGVVVRPSQIEDETQLCGEPKPLDTTFIGSTTVTYPSSKGTVLVWKLTTRDDGFTDNIDWESTSDENVYGRGAVLTADVGNGRAETKFTDTGLAKMGLPGGSGTATKEPAFEVLDFYQDQVGP